MERKIQPWIGWALNSQRKGGFFGPSRDYEPEPRLQHSNSEDWQPYMAILKIMKQHCGAAGDTGVIPFLTRYFRYQSQALPQKPLGYWTFWAEYRTCDSLQIVYWLYNITGESFLLELGRLLREQSYDYVDMFLRRNDSTHIDTTHGVNLAQGIKKPIIYYQRDPDSTYTHAVKKAFSDIRKYHRQPQEIYGANEALHSNKPTRRIELCSIIGLMYSLESMPEIAGDIQFANHLEKLAYNALPTHITDSFMTRQYLRQPNRVMLTRREHNFDINHCETDIVYGLLTSYPCCTSNFHQGWPKFTQNLWYATAGNGVATLVYAPSKATIRVGQEVDVRVTETITYPMGSNIMFTLDFPNSVNTSCYFPLHLRILTWCQEAEIKINGRTIQLSNSQSGIEAIKREWYAGNQLELILPMKVFTSEWYENSAAVERGPLIYSLKIGERWIKKQIKDDPVRFRTSYNEVLPTIPWNYGLMDFDTLNFNKNFIVVEYPEKVKAKYFWNQESIPIEIEVKAKKIPLWTLYNETAGPQPHSRMTYGINSEKGSKKEITLVPYGYTTLRITEFPVLEKFD